MGFANSRCRGGVQAWLKQRRQRRCADAASSWPKKLAAVEHQKMFLIWVHCSFYYLFLGQRFIEVEDQCGNGCPCGMLSDVLP